MCGIAGFVNYTDAPERARLANHLQASRGPDHHAIWAHGNVAFAHQRLSIIDLSELSNQPFIKDGFVLIFNGEIYNYKEIRRRLEDDRDINFISRGDTEVVLEAYRCWGSSCLKHFVGMYAFAIFSLADGKLFLACDHFGIKPLYYSRTANTFAFASELKTLVRAAGINRRLNSFALISSLNYQWPSGHESIFAGCMRLKPAHWMEVNCVGNLSVGKEERYWSPETKLAEHTEEEWTIMLREHLEATVNRHMVSDVPVSSFLSGGLDSSLISVLASKQAKHLSTYTIATREKDKRIEKMSSDEKYASLLAKQFDFDHTEILIEPAIIEELPRVVKMLDEPIGDPAAINTFLICRAARERGVKILLSGMGADEIFLGYRRHEGTLYASQYHRLPEVIRSPLNWLGNSLPVRIGSRGIKTTRWIKRFLSFANLPSELAYRRSYSYYDEHELSQLIHGDYNNEIRQLSTEHHEYFFEKEGLDLENRMCFTDINLFMRGLNLTYTDRASMAASVEVRVPFIDREMVNFAMSIPGKLKFKNGHGKYILKKAAEKILPREIIYRPKASFGAPIRSWISNDLREMTEDLLSEENIRRRGILNYKFVRNLIDRDRRGLDDNAFQIYQLLTMELWFKEYYDK
ncbi:MAG: asparagine synthase (glutamine-hydrolyzing) [Bacteroidetes bacterium]|nr:asparagine synthase (glutamine-hydrolyzing) [Bacteroidota bacterium]